MITPAPTEISNLRYLKGVGPKRAIAFSKIGVHSLEDLIYFFPRRYEDRSSLQKIATLIPGQTATIQAEILKVRFKPIPRMPLLEVLVGDQTATLPLVWFNQRYLKNQFTEGQSYLFYGKVEFYKNRLQMSSPEYELIEGEESSTHAARITPIYPLTEGLFQRSLRHMMKEVVGYYLDKTIEEYLPEAFRRDHHLEPLIESLAEMHFPSSFEAQARARQRLVFDEFFIFELTLLKKIERLKTKYFAHELRENAVAKNLFLGQLPFELTPDQSKVLAEVAHDLSRSIPMNRLLQGDVGSGKTVIAAYALYLAALSGRQGVLLVPTEILAEQHYKNLRKIFETLKIEVALLTASTSQVRRLKLLAEIKKGKVQILIGTHAILQEEIQYQSLALLVTDEQHKFGVYQRNQLLHTNPRPHQLVMTATPIPRTLALTLYGDLKISTIRHLPKGRQPIKTYWITRKKQDLVLDHVLERLRKGDQVYIIFPLIEETEKTDLLAATQEYEKLKKGVFWRIKMGLVHGRVPPEQREAMMKSFDSGETQVLVATSVIEVGVDNPNATVMIIENAERFGLSQLHQMRGRIGRGVKPSECFLFGEPNTEEGKKRLRILTKTQDGFEIAEEDLKLRGPGDFWGTRQSGDPLFRVGNPLTDYSILEKARDAALSLTQEGWENLPQWQGLKKHLELNPLKY